MSLPIPPPVIGLFMGAAIWGMAHFLPQYNFGFVGQKSIGIALMIAGLLVDLSAVTAFFQAKTTINPLKIERASKLVDTGLFRFSRNPMYAGLLILLTGWSLYLGNPLALLLLVLFVWILTTFQIKPEERVLSQIFGDDYLEYCRRVRRWL